jgi:twitching motility two-component system response regulator PilH
MSAHTILVVDDSPTAQKITCDALKEQGFNVISAADGEEALEIASRLHPDLIVLDIILPKKNGFQVCRQLKTESATENIKILMLSSKNQASDKFWGQKQGADAYITKPFEDEELLAAIEALLTGENLAQLKTNLNA